MKKDHARFIFNLTICPDNKVRLVTQDIINTPVHKFIKMCDHWVYAGPVEPES